MDQYSTSLSRFAWDERSRLPEQALQRFLPAIGKVARYEFFLETIIARHRVLVERHGNLTRQIDVLMQPDDGPRSLSHAEAAVVWERSNLAQHLHLEVETYYVFAKILLDRVAHFIEHAFGAARQMSLDSHDKFTKYFKAYLTERKLNGPVEYHEVLENLKRRVADFRDYQIAHEKSPYRTYGTIFGPTHEPRALFAQFPPASVRSKGFKAVKSEDLADLHSAITSHVSWLIEFYTQNRQRSVFVKGVGDLPALENG